jgi:hypothetical protein
MTTPDRVRHGGQRPGENGAGRAERGTVPWFSAERLQTVARWLDHAAAALAQPDDS